MEKLETNNEMLLNVIEYTMLTIMLEQQEKDMEKCAFELGARLGGLCSVYLESDYNEDLSKFLEEATRNLDDEENRLLILPVTKMFSSLAQQQLLDFLSDKKAYLEDFRVALVTNNLDDVLESVIRNGIVIPDVTESLTKTSKALAKVG